MANINDLFKAGEIAVQIARCIAVRFVGKFARFKAAKANGAPVNCNARPPLAALCDFRNALKSTFVGFETPAISRVFLRSSVSQVCPSVVALNTIFVVNVVSRPVACHYEKCKPMGEIGLSEDADPYISRSFGKTCLRKSKFFIPSSNFAGSKFPEKCSGFRMIIQQGFNKIRSQVRQGRQFLSHTEFCGIADLIVNEVQ